MLAAMLNSMSAIRVQWGHEEKMSESEQTDQVTSAAEDQGSLRKPYAKPAFRHEHLFETGALSCGKVQSTQGSCHSNRKTS